MVTDLGEQPIPETEPADPPPGGVDAVVEREYDLDPLVPDLSVRQNPHVEVPDSVADGEDSDDGATTDGASEPEKESPA